MEGQGPTTSPAKLWPQKTLDLVGGSCLEKETRVEMWGFNITGPIPFVIEVFNYDQDNGDENIGPNGISDVSPQRGSNGCTLGLGCSEPRRGGHVGRETESFLNAWFLSLDGRSRDEGMTSRDKSD